MKLNSSAKATETQLILGADTNDSRTKSNSLQDHVSKTEPDQWTTAKKDKHFSQERQWTKQNITNQANKHFQEKQKELTLTQSKEEGEDRRENVPNNRRNRKVAKILNPFEDISKRVGKRRREPRWVRYKIHSWLGGQKLQSFYKGLVGLYSSDIGGDVSIWI